MLTRQRGGALQVVVGQGMAVPGVLQAQQAGAREMRVVGFDRRRDVGQRHAALGVLAQGLGLHAAQHGRATAFVAVGVGQLTDDVLVTAPAMRQDAAQIALRAAGHEQRRLFAQQGGHARLQGVDGRVIAKHIVAHRRGEHGRAHGGAGTGDGVAAQVNGGRIHGSGLTKNCATWRGRVR